MRRFLLLLFMAGALAIAAGDGDPAFTADGQLTFPQDYRQWIFLSSGLGMTYGPAAQNSRSPLFDNVFVKPESYRAFLETGKWPDQTIFVLEIRSAASHGFINKDGHFQRDLVAVEAAVKDTKRFEGEWAYFGFPAVPGPLPSSAKAFPKGSCFTCHNTNAAVENSFVQFYPTLLEVAERKGTLKASYRATLTASPASDKR
jgi:hypothetical protein